jgi:hypothetical protein
LKEIWYRSDTRTTVSFAVDPRSVALSATVLLVGSAFVISGSPAMLRRRRRELATLRALGWRRRYVAWRLIQEFALISATAGTLAVLIAYAVDAAQRSDPATGWPLLSLPAAAVMTVIAAWWQVRRATAEQSPTTDLVVTRLARRAREPGAVGHLARRALCALRRNALGSVVITVACGALGLELAVRWVFGGVIVGSWFGQPFSWQDDPVDLAAVLAIVAMAIITMTDINWLSAQRTVELRTLRAIGWSAGGVARLVLSDALMLGLVGGVIASALDVTGLIAIVHSPPAGLAVVAVAVIGLGAALSLITVGLAAAVERAAQSTRLKFGTTRGGYGNADHAGGWARARADSQPGGGGV